MSTPTLSNKLSLVIALAGILAASAVFAATTTPTPITFPVAELGGCADKTACHAYCDISENATACQAFAQSHNLTPKVQVTPDPKIVAAIKNGGPGGCNSLESCRVYCGNPDNVQECTAFAQEHGFAKPQGTPKSRTEIRNTPGGCQTKDVCIAYCNNADHQSECLKFAQEHKLISPEAVKSIQETTTTLQKNFSGLPPHVKACIVERFGSDVVEHLTSGTLTPGPDLAHKLQVCFQAVRPSGSPMMRPNMTPGMFSPMPKHTPTSEEIERFNNRGAATSLPQPSHRPERVPVPGSVRNLLNSFISFFIGK